MVEVKRRSFPGCQSPAIIPLLAAAATAVAGVSCGRGVSTEEFEAVHEGLQTERAHPESLESSSSFLSPKSRRPHRFRSGLCPLRQQNTAMLRVRRMQHEWRTQCEK